MPLEVRAVFTWSAAMWVAFCHLLHLKSELSFCLFRIKVRLAELSWEGRTEKLQQYPFACQHRCKDTTENCIIVWLCTLEMSDLGISLDVDESTSWEMATTTCKKHVFFILFFIVCCGLYFERSQKITPPHRAYQIQFFLIHKFTPKNQDCPSR